MSKGFMSRAVYIHCCKDRTLTYRTKGQPVFNGVALPVFSVDTEEEAKDLITLVSRAQYEEHPQLPGQVWYKITLSGDLDFKHALEIEDLRAVTDKLESAYQHIKERT